MINNKELAKLIKLTNSLQMDISKMANDVNELQNSLIEIQLRNSTQPLDSFKNFFFENFEITNNPKDYVLCKDITRFFIIHYPHDLSAKQIEISLNKIIKSSTKRFNNKFSKVKSGIRPIKLDSEFPNH